ncbi:MAG: hypothetical protein MMC33_006512 [Icmadophila ericetorum]|nr:hypothetical protein [Icmadophila ericetorum]
MTLSSALIVRYPPTQPPSHKPPEIRKSQLHRQYTSLLRSTPLLLLFQHNNLKAAEWIGVRRELTTALRKLDEARAAAGEEDLHLADTIKIQIIQTGIFAATLRVVEYFRPEKQPTPCIPHPTDLATQSSATIPHTARDHTLRHGLSKAAHNAARWRRFDHALTPILSGPLMVVSFPIVSTVHLKTVLSILSPSPPDFPAPTRRANPDYHEPVVQSGLQKLLLLGARIEGRVFDYEGAKWVGKIEGGLEGMRGQLVVLLQSIGAGVTNTLESAGRSLYFTVEGRRGMLEEEEKKKEEGENEGNEGGGVGEKGKES